MKRWIERRLAQRDERGIAALLVALMTGTLFMGCAAMGVDVSRWYVEVQRVQKAADAAATAGVTYLPGDFAKAQAKALAIAALNGYGNDTNSSVTVSLGAKPTQLVVTVSSTVANSFANALGVPTTTVARSATADYVGPAPMGSPCNSFGNESDPAGSVNDGVHGPTTKVTVNPAGGATCGGSTFWAAIAGPDTKKGNGDQIASRTCDSGTDGCSGTTNTDFNPEGYFYLVRVGDAAVNHAITLQIYDPAWISTGDTCEKSPTGISSTANPWVSPGVSTRYPTTPTNYCTGDVDNTSSGKDYPITTSYGLRSPVDTSVPDQAPPVPGCEKQYTGYAGYQPSSSVTMQSPWGLSASTLVSPTNGPVNQVATTFHQWVTFCTFTPTTAGDYYLQVRTDVAAAGTSDGNGGLVGNAKVYTQTGDDTSVHGTGNNRFALRVVGDTTVTSSVSVAGLNHMGIYANYTGGSPTFNLVRVIPAAATKTLVINFFDVGDASQAGTVQVLPPSDSNLGSSLTTCQASGVANGNINNCLLTNVSSSNYNGKNQQLSVQIPPTYTCQSSQAGGCWFRVKMSFPGGLDDTTTWSAQISGDPVRLIE